MRRIVFLLIFSLAASLGFIFADDTLSGEEIMELVDANQFYGSARFESDMIILDRGREIRKQMISYTVSDGTVTHALSEFTNPRDRGTKYLLLDDELWMYFPDAEDLVRISGHMLEQNMMGSDFSYQDALESEKLTDLYTFEKTGEETYEGRRVYVLEAYAAPDSRPAYYHRRFLVDAERFVILKDEMYARGGRLLKEMITTKVEEVQQDRWMPMEMVMEDKLKAGSQTRLVITKLELDYEMPSGLFSLRSLQR